MSDVRFFSLVFFSFDTQHDMCNAVIAIDVLFEQTTVLSARLFLWCFDAILLSLHPPNWGYARLKVSKIVVSSIHLSIPRCTKQAAKVVTTALAWWKRHVDRNVYNKNGVVRGAVWLQIYHMCHFLNVYCYLFQWHALLRRRLDIFFRHRQV